MSIILEGEITNKLITGTNGEFSVGNFVTDIGKFKIRSTLLDQFDEGEYHEAMIQEFGFTENEASKHTTSARSYLAYPLLNKV